MSTLTTLSSLIISCSSCYNGSRNFNFNPPHLVFYSSPISLSTPIKIKTKRRMILLKSAEDTSTTTEEEEEWVRNLPDKKKPLYSHSLPCIEGWLEQLGFYQKNDADRAVWFVQKSDWHAKLSLDLTDLYIRYLKSGPGSLDKDVERRFSYALSREDIENAILGGP